MEIPPAAISSGGEGRVWKWEWRRGRRDISGRPALKDGPCPPDSVPEVIVEDREVEEKEEESRRRILSKGSQSKKKGIRQRLVIVRK